MGAFLDLLKRKPQALWLDSHAYCEKLLAGGSAPWLDAASFVAWQRKALGLLKPDVAVLPLAPVVKAWLASHADLREAMAAKSRATYPLKILLADEPLRAHLVELARGLRAGVAGLALALVLPSPRAWAALAYQQAHAQPVEIGEDEADSASVYVADFLRIFGESGVDALLLEESPQTEPANAAEAGWYQSVINLARHYRWDVGLHLPLSRGEAGVGAGLDFIIAPRPQAGTACGLSLAPEFWSGVMPPPRADGGFVYAEIPSAVQPETVLVRLETLR